MAMKKPVRRIPSSAKEGSGQQTLMSHQDTRDKGDAVLARKKDKCITFWVTADQKAEISAFAAEHNTTVSRLIVEGLEMRMRK